jgi:hypothetical protein
MNECSSCGRDYGSLRAFDAHRLGQYPQRGPSEYVGPVEGWTPEKGRRCMTTEELEEAGFIRNAYGRVTLPGAFLESAATDLEEAAA